MHLLCFETASPLPHARQIGFGAPAHTDGVTVTSIHRASCTVRSMIDGARARQRRLHVWLSRRFATVDIGKPLRTNGPMDHFLLRVHDVEGFKKADRAKEAALDKGHSHEVVSGV